MSKGALLKGLNESVAISICIQIAIFLLYQSINPLFYLQSFWVFTALLFIIFYLDNKGPKTIINYYPNGKILSKFIVINGFYEGKSWAWHDNGQLAGKTNWKAGVPNGLFIRWNSNGQKQSSIMFKDGLLHGKSVYYKNDGKRREEWNYKNDIQHGWHREYFGNKVTFEECYVNGKLNGITVLYRNPGLVGMFAFHKNDMNKLMTTRHLKDGELIKRW